MDLEEIHVDNGDVLESEKLIYKNAKEEFEIQEKVVFIGGDHSISYPLVKAFYETFKEDSFLIVFDAHADCDECCKEPTHEEWLRGVIESGFSPEKIILIGLRKVWKNEKKFLAEKGVKFFGCDCDLEGAADYIMEIAKDSQIYLSVDIDVFEPSVAQGVHYPEPSGLTAKGFFYLFKRFLHLPNLRVLDVVEIVPWKNEKYDFRTVKLGAKIVKVFLERNSLSSV